MPRRAVSRGLERIEASDAGAVEAAPPAPAAPARVTATIPARFRGRARRDAAAFYLSQLAKGVLAGEMTVTTSERPVTLATTEFVALEIEVKQKKRANHVTIKLRWPRRPMRSTASRTASGRGRCGCRWATRRSR